LFHCSGAINFNEFLNFSPESDSYKIEALQPAISPDAGSMIQFTSGTTGQPKATLLSHFGMVNNSFSIGIRNELHKKHARISMPLPLNHVGGCVISACGSLHFGATMVFPSPHFDGEAMLKSIVNERCTMFVGTPTFFVDLLAKQRVMELRIPEIDVASVGGSVLSPQVVKDIETIMKVKKITSVYGLTETSSAIMQTLPEDNNSSVEEFVGVVSSNVEAKVIDRNGNTVPFGQPGELCIRSSCNMLCYFNEPEKTKEAMGDDKW
jgi:acyl-CoA synthetase (AMP-forming)/AMP-acid ligase II